MARGPLTVHAKRGRLPQDLTMTKTADFVLSLDSSIGMQLMVVDLALRHVVSDGQRQGYMHYAGAVEYPSRSSLPVRVSRDHS